MSMFRAIFALRFAGTGFGIRNSRLVGPIDAGKSFLLVVPGVTAMQARHLVRYFTARSNRRGKPRSEASGNPKIGCRE